MNNHCCQDIKIFIADPCVQIFYSLRMREYYIPLIEFGIETPVKQGICYCPRCRVKLSESVRDQCFDTLEKEYNIDCHIDAEEAGTLPGEFKTDEWWKKREL